MCTQTTKTAAVEKKNAVFKNRELAKNHEKTNQDSDPGSFMGSRRIHKRDYSYGANSSCALSLTQKICHAKIKEPFCVYGHHGII